MTYHPLLIVGPSGSGKSTSIENLDPETTAILNVERKPLPFRKQFPKTVSIDTAPKLDIELKKAVQDDSVKVIVIDSLTEWCHLHKAKCQMLFKGYDIFSNYASGIRKLVDDIKNYTEKFIVVLSQDEQYDIIAPGGSMTTGRVAAVLEGNKIRGKLEPCFTTVVFTAVTRKDDHNVYEFATQTDGVTTAKSPKDMLPPRMPNDINEVLKKQAEYWSLAY